MSDLYGESLFHLTLQSIASLYNLSQHVSGPTCVQQDGSSSTIDLLFSNEESLVHKCETVPPLSTSDHYGSSQQSTRNLVNRELKVRAAEFGDIHMQIGMVPVGLSMILTEV